MCLCVRFLNALIVKRYRDIRLDKSHETLLFMRTIRLLGWEDIAEHRIKRYRDLEMHQRTLRMYISTASSWLSSSAGEVSDVRLSSTSRQLILHKREAGSTTPTTCVAPYRHTRVPTARLVDTV